MKFVVGIILIIICFTSVSALNETIFCSQSYDFIIENYHEGEIKYSTEQLINFTNLINNKLGSDLSSETIIEYINNYPVKCSEYKELPVGYFIQSLKSDPNIKEKSLYDKYKYEIIFISLILIGVFGFEYLKKKRREKK